MKQVISCCHKVLEPALCEMMQKLTCLGDPSADGLRQAGSVAISRSVHHSYIAGFRSLYLRVCPLPEQHGHTIMSEYIARSVRNKLVGCYLEEDTLLLEVADLKGKPCCIASTSSPANKYNKSRQAPCARFCSCAGPQD